MKYFVKCLLACSVAAVTVSASVSAFAASEQLTSRECHSYPFVKTAGSPTHHQLMTELGELEANGYQPNAVAPMYPSRLDKAEHLLHVEYREDCTKISHVAQGSSIGGNHSPRING